MPPKSRGGGDETGTIFRGKLKKGGKIRDHRTIPGSYQALLEGEPCSGSTKKVGRK